MTPWLLAWKTEGVVMPAIHRSHVLSGLFGSEFTGNPNGTWLEQKGNIGPGS